MTLNPQFKPKSKSLTDFAQMCISAEQPDKPEKNENSLETLAV